MTNCQKHKTVRQMKMQAERQEETQTGRQAHIDKRDKDRLTGRQVKPTNGLLSWRGYDGMNHRPPQEVQIWGLDQSVG